MSGYITIYMFTYMSLIFLHIVGWMPYCRMCKIVVCWHFGTNRFRIPWRIFLPNCRIWVWPLTCAMSHSILSYVHSKHFCLVQYCSMCCYDSLSHWESISFSAIVSYHQLQHFCTRLSQLPRAILSYLLICDSNVFTYCGYYVTFDDSACLSWRLFSTELRLVSV